jgi:hypothetical protein
MFSLSSTNGIFFDLAQFIYDVFPFQRIEPRTPPANEAGFIFSKERKITRFNKRNTCEARRDRRR